MNVGVDPQRTVDLLRLLVQTESVNPSLVAGGSGEGEIAAFVAGVLSDAGIQSSLQDVAPGRPNVIGGLSGSQAGGTLVLNAHLDANSCALYPIILRNFPKRQRVRQTVLVSRSADEAVLTPAPCAG